MIIWKEGGGGKEKGENVLIRNRIKKKHKNSNINESHQYYRLYGQEARVVQYIVRYRDTYIYKKMSLDQKKEGIRTESKRST